MLARVEAVRARMMRFDPVGLFALTLRGMPRGPARRAQPPGSGDAGAARQSRSAGAPRPAAADGGLRRRCRRYRGHDRPKSAALDPKPGSDSTPTPLSPVVPDVLMRRGAGRLLDAGTQPGDDAARSRQPALLRARRLRAPARRIAASSPSGCRRRTGWSSRSSSGRRPFCGSRPRSSGSRTGSSGTASRICGR